MANKDDYLTHYREFFENFAQTVNPNDQLPVKLASYKLVNIEVVGGIIDWTTQYLTQKNCPPNLVSPLIKIVIEEIRKACKKQPVLCGFNVLDNAYEPLKLMQTVMAKTNEVCLRYLDNSMLCSLPSPGTPFFPTSACAVRNSRRRMEDRHVIIHDLNTMFNNQEASPSSYYAVFDGHAGHDAAAYSSAHLHQYLAENKYFASNPEKALLDAFCKTDALFLEKCKVENLNSGTTAVVALLRPKEKMLYIAWVGDSQAVIVNQGRVRQIVQPHKPSRLDEQNRITEQGGCVSFWGTWRVNGQLAVSRAIGDADYKPHVIAIPDIQELLLDGSEDFLIIACDGLWDFLSEISAAKAVYCLITENPDDTDRISQHLVQLAKQEGSNDNISVIVVFLKEPSKIAAEAHWANRNCQNATTATETMEAGLDNANNPFAISNGGSNTDNILSQKTDSLLLNLTDKYKQNGSDVSPSADFPLGAEEKSKNGSSKRTASSIFDDEDPEDDDDDEDDEDFGPETNVDALSPVLETSKGFFGFGNNNPTMVEEAGVLNPFVEHQEKAAAAVQLEHGLQKMWEQHEEEQQQQQQEHQQEQGSQEEQVEQERQRMARDETPTPPADTVHDVSGLVENAAESDSEDEWNYIKGEEANKENIEPQPSEKEVAEIPEEDDNMSQLNPNAAEFVPVSPTRSIPSPACRMIMNDEVISQSPKRPLNVDINLPNPKEFEKEVKSRPSEVDTFSNGHKSDDDLPTSPTHMMENLLNGKNIDEIPEFQPGSTPQKNKPSEEFHFGPNAAPFTPVKLLDQSEAALSTKAVFGDESTATLGMSLNESTPQIDIHNKESDPMSMSFYAEKDDVNPFDLDQVQILPENLDDFLNQPDEVSKFDILDTQNKLSERFTLNNDDAIQITDLDKQSYDDEKELASPLEPEKELIEPEKDLLSGTEECDHAAETPEPMYENLIDGEFCKVGEKSKLPQLDPLSREVELISPELKPGSATEHIVESKSPLLQATEVSDLLQTEDVNVPHDVEIIAPELLAKLSAGPNPEGSVAHQVDLLEPAVASLVQDVLDEEESKAPACELPVSASPVCELQSSKSPVTELEKPSSPICELTDTHTPVSDAPAPYSPVGGILTDLPPTKSDVFEFPESKSPVYDLLASQSPVCHLPASKSPICDLPASKSPICDLLSNSSVCDIQETKFPVCDISEKSSVGDVFESKSPIPQQNVCNFPTSDDPFSVSSIPAEATCDFTKPELIQEAEQKFEELCKPYQAEDRAVESPQEDVTSSLKDDISPPAKSPVDSPADPSALVTESIEDIQEVEERVQTPVIETLQRQAQEPEIESCSIFSPKSTADTESVITDVTSFLERSLPPEVASPLSPPEQDVIQSTFSVVNEQYKEPDQPSEQIDIKTENISPEFAEQAIVTPSEESKQEDVCVAPPVEEPVKEHIEEKPQNESVLEEVATAAAAAGAAVAAVLAATPSPKKTDDKKKPTSAKKPTASKSTGLTGRPTSKTVPATKTTTSRLSTAPKTTAPRPGTATKSSTEISAPKPTQAKTTASKPKSYLSTTTMRTTTRLATAPTTGTKLSPGKTSAPKPAPSPRTSAPPKPAPITRPATAPKTTASRPTTATSSTLASKPRPANLTSRTTPTKPPSATPKPSVTKTSPRTVSAPTAAAPRPRIPSTITAKQRVPLTKTATGRAPDTVKQNKESANKLTASRSLTGTAGSSATRTTSNSARKVESKTLASRTTVSKSTTTTMKSTTSKKPTEIIRNKTKTTKIEKPKENGVSTVVTEAITIVNTTNTVIDNESQLLKDNSPLDNKLLIEEKNTLIDTNVAD